MLHSHTSYGNREIIEVKETFQAQYGAIEQQLATVMTFQNDELASKSMKEDDMIAKVRQVSQDFDTLVYSQGKVQGS